MAVLEGISGRTNRKVVLNIALFLAKTEYQRTFSSQEEEKSVILEIEDMERRDLLSDTTFCKSSPLPEIPYCGFPTAEGNMRGYSWREFEMLRIAR